MSDFIGYTGGETKGNKWPHPMNDKFNSIIRNTVEIYGVGSKRQRDLIQKCQEYLKSRIAGLIDHKIRRDTEEYYKAMSLKFTHGVHKREDEQQKLISECSFVLCVGDWNQEKECEHQYRLAVMLGKPIFHIRYENSIPLNKIIRYLQPVRPIKDAAWDHSKQDDVLIYENEHGLLELMDGNHRHEFANRVGGVEYLSGWIIKQI